jgi:hypothetical protein
MKDESIQSLGNRLADGNQGVSEVHRKGAYDLPHPRVRLLSKNEV